MSAVITAALRTGRHAAAAVVSEGRGAGPAPGAPAPPGPPPAAPGPPAGAPTAKAAAKRAARAAARPALDGNYARYYGYRLALGGRAAPVPPPRSEPVDARVAALAGPAGRDPRLAALDLRSLLRGRAVLDVGCNAGLIPLALAVLGKPASVLGVDVDACLIRDAVRHLSTARSAAATLAADARAPGRARSAGEDAGRALRRVTFRREDVVASASAAAPGAGAAAAAPVAAPPAGGAGRGNDTLPHPPPPPPAHPPAGYGAVFCLSVTKWVHVRGGDGALAAFLARLAALTAPGGHLILEPQPWSSYEAAARKKLAGPRVGGPPLSELALRPDGFADHLEAAHGLKLVARRVPSGVARGFARELLVFKKPAAVAV